jgi:hypothetical protein
MDGGGVGVDRSNGHRKLVLSLACLKDSKQSEEAFRSTVSKRKRIDLQGGRA